MIIDYAWISYGKDYGTSFPRWCEGPDHRTADICWLKHCLIMVRVMVDSGGGTITNLFTRIGIFIWCWRRQTERFASQHDGFATSEPRRWLSGVCDLMFKNRQAVSWVKPFFFACCFLDVAGWMFVSGLWGRWVRVGVGAGSRLNYGYHNVDGIKKRFDAAWCSLSAMTLDTCSRRHPRQCSGRDSGHCSRRYLWQCSRRYLKQSSMRHTRQC